MVFRLTCRVNSFPYASILRARFRCHVGSGPVPCRRVTAASTGLSALPQGAAAGAGVAERFTFVRSQTFSVLSFDPLAIRVPSGLKATLVTTPMCPRNVNVSWPVDASQILTVLSWDAARDPLPVRTERDASDTSRVPFDGQGLLARGRSHTFTVSSSDPLAIRFPSGLKATLSTSPVCPFRVKVSWPVDASQTLTVLSWDAVAIRFPSRLNATWDTDFEWPRSVKVCWPVDASQTFTVLSTEFAIRLPSGLKTTLATYPYPPKGQHLSARGRIPDLHRFVRSTRDPRPVRTEGDAGDQIRVPSQGQGLLTPGRIPDLHASSPRPLAIRFPSGLKATLNTGPVCPRKVNVSWPVDASQTFTVLSPDPLAIRFPSGLKATWDTDFEWPRSVKVC